MFGEALHPSRLCRNSPLRSFGKDGSESVRGEAYRFAPQITESDMDKFQSGIACTRVCFPALWGPSSSWGLSHSE